MITRRSLSFGVTAACATLPFSLVGCGPSIPDTLKIGVVVAQSGPFAARGIDLLRGAQMAADELNTAGFKIAGRAVKVEIIGFDDKGEDDLAVDGARQLLAGGALAIIGPLNTPQAVKMIPVVAESGRAHFFTATAAKLHSLGAGNTFRLLANDDQQGQAAASFVSDNLKPKRVAVLHESGDYGSGLNAAFSEAYKKLGGSVGTTLAIETKASVTAEQMARLKAEGTDAVVFFSRGPHLQSMFKAMQEVGFTDVSVLGSNVIRNRSTLSMKSPVRALYATATAFDAEEFPNGRLFARNFEARHKERVAWGAHYAYDAVLAFAHAVQTTGKVDAATINAHLKTKEPTTKVNDQLRFGANGEQRYASIAIYKLHDSDWRLQMHSAQW